MFGFVFNVLPFVFINAPLISHIHAVSAQNQASIDRFAEESNPHQPRERRKKKKKSNVYPAGRWLSRV